MCQVLRNYNIKMSFCPLMKLTNYLIKEGQIHHIHQAVIMAFFGNVIHNFYQVKLSLLQWHKILPGLIFQTVSSKHSSLRSKKFILTDVSQSPTAAGPAALGTPMPPVTKGRNCRASWPPSAAAQPVSHQVQGMSASENPSSPFSPLHLPSYDLIKSCQTS